MRKNKVSEEEQLWYCGKNSSGDERVVHYNTQWWSRRRWRRGKLSTTKMRANRMMNEWRNWSRRGVMHLCEYSDLTMTSWKPRLWGDLASPLVGRWLARGSRTFDMHKTPPLLFLIGRITVWFLLHGWTSSSSYCSLDTSSIIQSFIPCHHPYHTWVVSWPSAEPVGAGGGVWKRNGSSDVQELNRIKFIFLGSGDKRYTSSRVSQEAAVEELTGWRNNTVARKISQSSCLEWYHLVSVSKNPSGTL